MPSSFLRDLKQIFAPAQTDVRNYTGATSVVLTTQPTEVYGGYFNRTVSSSTAEWNLIDATATSVGGPSKLRYTPYGTSSHYSMDLIRPIYFGKGLTISYTATGGSFIVSLSYGSLSPLIDSPPRGA